MKYTFILLSAMAVSTSYAQDTYRGKVLNTFNQGVENATITVNDSVVAKTNQYGNFEVKASDSFVAYIYAEG